MMIQLELPITSDWGNSTHMTGTLWLTFYNCQKMKLASTIYTDEISQSELSH